MMIRQENEDDYKVTEQIVEEAFKDAEFTTHEEHLLVQRLRQSEEFIPELSIVAEDNGGKIVGHILFTKMWISGEKETESLSLAPVSVLPEYQSRGIGSELIRAGLSKAKDLGFESVILVGHSSYYPRFGFEKASKWDIRFPIEVPDEAFMALELKRGSLTGKSGVVKFSKAFGIDK